MNSFLVKFGAVQSRIASYSCPPGVPGRVHAIRLRRCFQYHHQPSRAFTAHQSYTNVPQPQLPIDHELDDELGDETIPLEENAASTADSGETLEDLAGASPATDPDKEPELVKWVPYPSVQFESRLRLARHRRENRSQIRMKVPGEDGDSGPPITFSMVGRDYERTFYNALRKGDPHLVLAVLGKLVLRDGKAPTSLLLERLPAPTFSALLHCLGPEHFVGRYQELHKSISPHMAQRLRLPPVDDNGYYRFCDMFLNQVNGFFAARNRSIPLSLRDFRYLLRCARATGNGMIADDIWRNLSQMKDRNVMPDLECYNHYLATLCWADALNPITRYRLRIIHRNYEPRNWKVPPRPLKGYRTGPGGLKARVSEVFRDMVQAGVAGNEETFCHMIIAFAREGDLNGVESILKRVWGINVNHLMKSEGVEPPAKEYARSSPFYPSQQLLYSIAHAYGINNAIPTALRLVDFVSRQYSTPIYLNTWRELLKWTHVLSLKRHPPLLADFVTRDWSNLVGELPREAISNFWDTMTSEPYNARPSIDMYDPLITNLLSRDRYGEAQKRMEEARSLYKKEVGNLEVLLNAFNKIYPRIDNPVLDAKKRQLDFLLLRSRVNRQLIKKWVRNLIKKANTRMTGNTQWRYRGLPKVLLHWKLYLPDRIEYGVATGEVKFWTGTHAEKRLRAWKRQQPAAARIGRLRRRRRKRIL